MLIPSFTIYSAVRALSVIIDLTLVPSSPLLLLLSEMEPTELAIIISDDEVIEISSSDEDSSELQLIIDDATSSAETVSRHNL